MKIINIMAHPPAYELFWNEAKPRTRWELSDGRWVGIWEDEWLDLIGNEVLKLATEFEFEVWQPDLRADRMYYYEFESGLMHRLFPGEEKKKRYGIRKVLEVDSCCIYERLIREIAENKIILRIGISSATIVRRILDSPKACPIVLQCFGEFKGPLDNLFRPKKNFLGKINDLREHHALKRIFAKADVITYTSEFSKENLQTYFEGETISLSIGIDFDYWRCTSNKCEVKRRLGIEHNKYIILSSSRLNSLKQIDKVAAILSNFHDMDFVYVITGHGDREYEQYLHNISKQLMDNGKLIFTGHLTDEVLKDFYTVADLFIMSSISEAGPTSTIKAMAMEVPVFTTDTGQMAEVLAKHGAGIIVPRKDYRTWEQELREILSGKKVEILDREIVKGIHHWPYVAKQYIELYRRLFKQYYG